MELNISKYFIYQLPHVGQQYIEWCWFSPVSFNPWVKRPKWGCHFKWFFRFKSFWNMERLIQPKRVWLLEGYLLFRLLKLSQSIGIKWYNFVVLRVFQPTKVFLKERRPSLLPQNLLRAPKSIQGHPSWLFPYRTCASYSPGIQPTNT